MRKQFPFEKLDVWQDARNLVGNVYDRTRTFPKDEHFGLTSQLPRVVVSVANYFAERCGRSSLTDPAHDSLLETASDLIIATDLSFISEKATNSILSQGYDLSVRIHHLRESQLHRAEGL